MAYLLVRDRIEGQYKAYRDAQRKRNDDVVMDAEEQTRLRAVRMRQQEIHAQKAAKAAEERAKLEAEKAERKLEEYDRMQGKSSGFRLGDGKSHSTSTPSDPNRPTSKPRFRPLNNNDSMPLAGFSGGSSGFRSSRSKPRAGG